MLIIEHVPEALTASLGWQHHRDPGEAERSDLLWYFFPGDILMSAGGLELRSDVGSVPGLHLAASLVLAVRDLERAPPAAFDYHFTEADHVIEMVRDGDQVRVTGSFTSTALTVPREEFALAVHRFVRHYVRARCLEYPDLKTHALVTELLAACRAPADGSSGEQGR